MPLCEWRLATVDERQQVAGGQRWRAAPKGGCLWRAGRLETECGTCECEREVKSKETCFGAETVYRSE